MLASKAQLEIIGLAIIVLLVGLGLLFAIQWTLKKPVNTLATTKENRLASTFLQVLVNTNTDCNQLAVKELLQDCALRGGSITCITGNSCDHARYVTQTIISKTLDVWRKKYQFSIDGSDATNRIRFPPTNQIVCPGEKESQQYVLTVTSGFDITLALDIC